MNKNRIIISTILLFYFLLSPSCSNGTQSINEIKEKIDAIYHELGIIINDTVYTHDNSLVIEIQYIKDYYLTDESNDLIICFLFYRLGNMLEDFESVVVRTLFKGLSDDNTDIYKANSIERMQSRFVKNIRFRKTFLYLIKNLNANEIIGFNELIIDTKVAAPDLFKQEGEFWLLVEDYTKYCNDTTSVAFKSMNLLQKATKFPERPFKPEVIEGIINLCNEI